MSQRKLILYIAASLDGIIAKPNDDLSFLDKVQVEGEDYGYFDFIAKVDTVILGRKTYDWVMKEVGEFPHADKKSYVITRQQRDSVGKTEFYNGNLTDLIGKIRAEDGKHIFCDGGAQLVNALLNEKLFDEIILSVIPVILGEGTKLFQEGIPEQELVLKNSKSFDSGLVQLHYQLKQS